MSRKMFCEIEIQKNCLISTETDSTLNVKVKISEILTFFYDRSAQHYSRETSEQEKAESISTILNRCFIVRGIC